MAYLQLSKEIQEQIIENRKQHWENPYACKDTSVIRKYSDHDVATLWRPAFVRDCEKVMHNPYYSRYSDKTQVFSLMKNDDISRRAQHVQLVSRIARNIGSLLGLNLDLIEAISLGHDIGHTPFGHAGERKLDEIYYGHTGRHFNHNIQSARVFMTIAPVNMSLQTLDGIICHNGELELQRYEPEAYDDFSILERKIEDAYQNTDSIKNLIPNTLEGCVMRISDIIAYLGKDIQDAIKIGALEDDREYGSGIIGQSNAQMINNICVNLIENSYGKNYLALSEEYFQALKDTKKQNNQRIYMKKELNEVFDLQIYPMFECIYEQLRKDYIEGNKSSVIFKHHLEEVEKYQKYYPGRVDYAKESVDAIVTDYIASMTDDYFIDLYKYLFPNGKHKVTYRGYFG